MTKASPSEMITLALSAELRGRFSWNDGDDDHGWCVASCTTWSCCDGAPSSVKIAPAPSALRARFGCLDALGRLGMMTTALSANGLISDSVVYAEMVVEEGRCLFVGRVELRAHSGGCLGQ